MIRPAAALLCCFLLYACESNNILKETRVLSYPSASAIEKYEGRFHIMGDDAHSLLVVDSTLAVADSVKLFPGEEKRIPKAIKPDLEAMTVIYAGPESLLLMIGSGSLVPFRNLAITYHFRTGVYDSIRLDSFYAGIRDLGIKELNIEGIASLPQGLVLANRGHLAYPKNHLIFTSFSVLSGRSQGPINVIPLGGNADSSNFSGVSGLTYSRKSDGLVLSVSTESTTNALDDGAIGKSYLWIIRNISSKRNWKAVNPDRIIDLEAVDERFRGQKIESVCIDRETADFFHLVLVADNDDGQSTIFRVVIEK